MTAQRTARPDGRHRRPRSPGPVTIAFRAIGRPRSRLAEFALRAWPALPALALARAVLHREMAAYADSVLGFDALLCLLACLAVTPFMTVARLRIAKLRWWYGIWVFCLGFAGLAVHLFTPAGAYMQRAAGTSADWTGLLIVVLLLPMAVTSCVAAQKALGPEWKRWQRVLVWAVTAAALAHLALMRDWLPAGAFTAALAPLIALRVPRLRRAVKSWRVAGYSTGGLWVILAILCTVLAAAVAVLLAREGVAVARAIELA